MSKRQRDGLDAPAKKAAKNRFKKLVRTVILNMQWLNEATEETGISLNVKKNVAMLVRQKRKVGMMTMAVSPNTLFKTGVFIKRYFIQISGEIATAHSTFYAYRRRQKETVQHCGKSGVLFKIYTSG